MASSQGFKESLPGSMRFIKKFAPILRKQKALICGSFLALFAEIFMSLLAPWPLKFVIDRVIRTEDAGGHLMVLPFGSFGPLSLLALASVSIVIIAQLRGVALYYNKVGFALIGNRLATKVRGMIYRKAPFLILDGPTTGLDEKNF